MLYRLVHFPVFRLGVVLVLLLLLLAGPMGSQAISPMTEGDSAVSPSNTSSSQENHSPTTPNACPLNSPPYSAGLEIIERTNFCVYYEEGAVSDYNAGILSLADATLAADHIEDYWDRYDVDFAFLAPAYTGKLEILLESGGSCNGATGSTLNYLYVYTECYGTAESIQKVLGHELFHRVQYSYDGSEVRWFKEGTAREIEDNAFTNIDNWAGTLSAVSSSFNKQVNEYLASTNNDITSDPMRYNSALWWKYFTEQYGTDPDEPELGVDALLALWEAAATSNDVAAVNDALSDLGAGVNFDAAFRQFAVANWTKDLTGVPDSSYNYMDEDQVGNGAPYGPLEPDDGGTINIGTSATWIDQDVDRYGISYYSATPGSDCPVISATFHEDSGPDAFYHVVTQIGTAFETHVEGSGTDWTQSFLNNGITQVVAIVGGQANDVQVDVTLSCADPVIEIELPNTLAPAYVGASGSPDDMVVQVSVTNGSATGPVVAGLTNSDFSVEVGGVAALVTGGGFVQEEYFLLVDTPIQGANGPYDLEVFLEEPGSSTVIASDTETEAVVYDNTNTDHVIITDVSGSMSVDGKMAAAQNAANLFIDAGNSSEGLGLVSYNHDVVDTLDIEFAILSHRDDAHDQVNNYVAGGATSIGDGLNEAVDLLAASTTGNARCQFTLLSDGMENSSLFWSDVSADVIATGCPVMTVAFGQASNELLMQDIATQTGGASYYNDVFVSGRSSAGGSPDDTELDLDDTYLYSLCEAQNCKRLLTQQGEVSTYGETVTHTLFVDDSVNTLTAVLDWHPGYTIPLTPEGGPYFVLTLIDPDGTVYDPPQYDLESAAYGYVGYHIGAPQPGTWQMVVQYLNQVPNKPYRVMAYGQTETAAYLLLPALPDGDTGDYFPIYAIWQPGGTVLANIIAPDGTPTVIKLWDDGQHGDGMDGDGFFAGLYTLVNQAVEVSPAPEPTPDPPPADEGAYRVHLLALAGNLRREAFGSFSVPEGDDGNSDGIPDEYIALHCPGAPLSDADLDQLDCSDEYFTGTDPNNSDTDGGGENDGSEVNFGQDPLNPTDDEIEAPTFIQSAAQNGSSLVLYDVKPEYTIMRLFRATSPTGPWALQVSELPLDGDYTDPAANETTYFYRLLAIDGDGHGSAILMSTAVTPRTDPIPPEAEVIIDDGAVSTQDRNVVLSFVPYGHVEEGEENSFDDITEMMISNDPFFTDAQWQPFAQDVPWELENTIPGVARVYVRFRDDNGNESVITHVGSILYTPFALYLPAILKPN